MRGRRGCERFSQQRRFVRKERVNLRKLFRYKVLHVQNVSRQPGALSGQWQRLQLLMVSGVRFAANCAALLPGFEHRLVHQEATALSAEESAEWCSLWNLLSAWYGQPSSEIFHASSLLARGKERQERA